MYDFFRKRWGGFRECLRQRLLVLFAYCALLLAVEGQQIAEVFSEVPDGGDGDLDSEVSRVGICDWDLEDGFAAAVELAQECLAVEQPRVGVGFPLEVLRAPSGC